MRYYHPNDPAAPTLSDAEIAERLDAENRAYAAVTALRAAAAKVQACIDNGDPCPVRGYDWEDMLPSADELADAALLDVSDMIEARS